MANLRTIKKPKDDGLTEVISVRVSKKLHADLAIIYANRIKSTGTIESFSQTVVEALELGASKLKTVA